MLNENGFDDNNQLGQLDEEMKRREQLSLSKYNESYWGADYGSNAADFPGNDATGAGDGLVKDDDGMNIGPTKERAEQQNRNRQPPQPEPVYSTQEQSDAFNAKENEHLLRQVRTIAETTPVGQGYTLRDAAGEQPFTGVRERSEMARATEDQELVGAQKPYRDPDKLETPGLNRAGERLSVHRAGKEAGWTNREIEDALNELRKLDETGSANLALIDRVTALMRPEEQYRTERDRYGREFRDEQPYRTTDPGRGSGVMDSISQILGRAERTAESDEPAIREVLESGDIRDVASAKEAIAGVMETAMDPDTALQILERRDLAKLEDGEKLSDRPDLRVANAMQDLRVNELMERREITKAAAETFVNEYVLASKWAAAHGMEAPDIGSDEAKSFISDYHRVAQAEGLETIGPKGEYRAARNPFVVREEAVDLVPLRSSSDGGITTGSVPESFREKFLEDAAALDTGGKEPDMELAKLLKTMVAANENVILSRDDAQSLLQLGLDEKREQAGEAKSREQLLQNQETVNKIGSVDQDTGRVTFKAGPEVTNQTAKTTIENMITGESGVIDYDSVVKFVSDPENKGEFVRSFFIKQGASPRQADEAVASIGEGVDPGDSLSVMAHSVAAIFATQAEALGAEHVDSERQSVRGRARVLNSSSAANIPQLNEGNPVAERALKRVGGNVTEDDYVVLGGESSQTPYLMATDLEDDKRTASVSISNAYSSDNPELRRAARAAVDEFSTEIFVSNPAVPNTAQPVKAIDAAAVMRSLESSGFQRTSLDQRVSEMVPDDKESLLKMDRQFYEMARNPSLVIRDMIRFEDEKEDSPVSARIFTAADVFNRLDAEVAGRVYTRSAAESVEYAVNKAGLPKLDKHTVDRLLAAQTPEMRAASALLRSGNQEGTQSAIGMLYLQDARNKDQAIAAAANGLVAALGLDMPDVAYRGAPSRRDAIQSAVGGKLPEGAVDYTSLNNSLNRVISEHYSNQLAGTPSEKISEYRKNIESAEKDVTSAIKEKEDMDYPVTLQERNTQDALKAAMKELEKGPREIAAERQVAFYKERAEIAKKNGNADLHEAYRKAEARARQVYITGTGAGAGRARASLYLQHDRINELLEGETND